MTVTEISAEVTYPFEARVKLAPKSDLHSTENRTLQCFFLSRSENSYFSAVLALIAGFCTLHLFLCSCFVIDSDGSNSADFLSTFSQIPITQGRHAQEALTGDLRAQGRCLHDRDTQLIILISDSIDNVFGNCCKFSLSSLIYSHSHLLLSFFFLFPVYLNSCFSGFHFLLFTQFLPYNLFQTFSVTLALKNYSKYLNVYVSVSS